AAILASNGLKNAGGIVLDSPATEVKTIVSNIMVNEHSVPRFLHPGIYLAAKLLYKLDINEVRPIDHIGALKETPLVFLHGEIDKLISPDNSLELSKKVNKSTKVIFEGARHVETYKTNPEKYKKIVSEFFAKNLE
ncbi:MAG: alpha/beta hydrolase, partial [Saprospiraceae bacterium]